MCVLVEFPLVIIYKLFRLCRNLRSAVTSLLGILILLNSPSTQEALLACLSALKPS